MNVVVYTKPGCQQCVATERALGKAGVAYERIEITVDSAAELRAQGFASAPVVITDDDSWAGFRPDKIKRLAA